MDDKKRNDDYAQSPNHRKEVKAMPEARVFRPRSEDENALIDKLMEVHTLEGNIQKPSWTLYAAYLINRDLAEVRAKLKGRV